MTLSWTVGLAASAVIAVTFVAVAVMLARNLSRGGQWHNNPLGVGTFLIFLTCGGGHALHTAVLAWPGLDPLAAAAMRHAYAQPTMWLVDGATAAAGTAYWLLRRRFPGLVSGAAVYEDLRVRQQKAMRIHDGVVRGLTEVEAILEVGPGPSADKAGRERLQDTLAASQRIITDLLGEEDIRPGALRRAEREPDALGAKHG